MQLKWYVLVTRPNWEKRVAEGLSRSEITNYYPEITRIERNNVKVIEPLFTSKIFIKISLRQQYLLNGIPGIVKFAYWLGRPAIVQEEEINTLKEFLHKNPSVTTKRIPVNFHDRRKLMKDLNKTKKPTAPKENKKSPRVIIPCLGYILIPNCRKNRVTEYVPASSINYKPINIYDF